MTERDAHEKHHFRQDPAEPLPRLHGPVQARRARVLQLRLRLSRPARGRGPGPAGPHPRGPHRPPPRTLLRLLPRPVHATGQRPFRPRRQKGRPRHDHPLPPAGVLGRHAGPVPHRRAAHSLALAAHLPRHRDPRELRQSLLLHLRGHGHAPCGGRAPPVPGSQTAHRHPRRPGESQGPRRLGRLRDPARHRRAGLPPHAGNRRWRRSHGHFLFQRHHGNAQDGPALAHLPAGPRDHRRVLA